MAGNFPISFKSKKTIRDYSSARLNPMIISTHNP